MRMILLEKVINVGNLGDVVKVKQGYAGDYLIRKERPEKRATPRHQAPGSEARRAQRDDGGRAGAGFGLEGLRP